MIQGVQCTLVSYLWTNYNNSATQNLSACAWIKSTKITSDQLRNWELLVARLTSCLLSLTKLSRVSRVCHRKCSTTLALERKWRCATFSVCVYENGSHGVCPTFAPLTLEPSGKTCGRCWSLWNSLVHSSTITFLRSRLTYVGLAHNLSSILSQSCSMGLSGRGSVHFLTHQTWVTLKWNFWENKYIHLKSWLLNC